MTATYIRRRNPRVAQKSPLVLRAADSIRVEGARIVRRCFPRAAKVYAQWISPWALSRARSDGGALAGCALMLMAMAPEDAMQAAMWLVSVAASRTTEGLCIEQLNREAMRSNAEDCVVTHEFDPSCPDSRARLTDVALRELSIEKRRLIALGAV